MLRQSYNHFTLGFLVIVPLFLAPGLLFAQSADALRRELTIDFETRPRAEYRNNFMWTPADTTMPDLYVTQRNRLSINYKTR